MPRKTALNIEIKPDIYDSEKKQQQQKTDRNILLKNQVVL